MTIDDKIVKLANNWWEVNGSQDQIVDMMISGDGLPDYSSLSDKDINELHYLTFGS